MDGLQQTFAARAYSSLDTLVDEDEDGIPDAWDPHLGSSTNNTSWWWSGISYWIDGVYQSLGQRAYATSNGLPNLDSDGIPDWWDPYVDAPSNNTSWWTGGEFWVDGQFTQFVNLPYAASGGLVDSDSDGIPDLWDLYDEDDRNHTSWWDGGWVWQDGVYWLHPGGYYNTGGIDRDGDSIPDLLDWYPDDPNNNTTWWSGGNFLIDGQLVTYDPWPHQATRTSQWGWTEPAVFDWDGDGLYDPIDPYMNDATNMGEAYILSSFDAITWDPNVTLDGSISGRPSLRRWLDTWFTSNSRWGSVPAYLRAGAPFATAADYDQDGIPDVMELYFGLDPEDYNDAYEQPNGGEYTRLELYRAGQNLADPADPLQQWQADYIPNVWKIHYEMDPLDPGVWLQNPDNDGYTNLEEYVAGYHPGIWDGVLPPEDSDADGFSDDAEVLLGMDPYTPLTLPGGTGAGTTGTNIALATHEIAHHFNIDGQPPDPPVPWRPGGGSGSSLPPASDPKDEYVIEVRWVATSTGDGADLHYGRRWVWRDEHGKRHEQSAGEVTGDAGSGADVRWEASDGRVSNGTGIPVPALASLPWRPLIMGEEVSGMHMYTNGGAYRALNNEESAVAEARFALEMSGLGSPGDPPVETAVLESGWYGRNGPLDVRLMSEVRLRRRSPEEIIAAGGTPPAETSDKVVQFVDVKSVGQTTPVVTTPQLFLAHDGALSQEKLLAPLSGQPGVMAVESLLPVELILDSNNIAYKLDSEALGVSNYVTNIELPATSQFNDTNPDPENFRLQARLPNSTANSIVMRLEVKRDGTVVSTTNHTLDKKDGDFVRGQFLRLVTDTNDDAESGDQTILVKLGDKIKVSYDIAAGSKVEQEIQVSRPSSEDNNEASKPWKHDIREVKVRIVAVKDEAGNACVTDAKVNELVDNANERLAQSGIRLKRTQATVEVIEPPSKPADDVGPAYTYDQNYQDGQVSGNLTSPSEDEIAFSRSKDGDANSIDIFFIKHFKSTVPARGIAYYSSQNKTGKPALSNFIVISADAVWPFTMPHEIMHILLNQGHRNFEPSTALFYSPTSQFKTTVGKKRIGPYPQSRTNNVGDDDTTTMRANAETLP